MTRNERSAGFVAFHANRDHDRQVNRDQDRPAQGPSAPVYLLLDYGRHWDFAKGHVESREADLAAATRELHEETGLTPCRVISGFQHEIVYFFRDRKKGIVRKTVVFFLAELPCRDVVLSHEHVGFQFLPFDEAIARLTYPSAKEVLRAAHVAVTAALINS